MSNLSSRGRRLPTVLSTLLVTPLVAVATVVALAPPGAAAPPSSAGVERAARSNATDAVAATAKRPARSARGIPPHVARLNWRGLARCESSNNPRAVNPAGYYGLYQFDVPTWRSVGGRGFPHHAAAPEQTYRAQRLYMSRGRSPWPHCGRYL